jgi:DNA-binding PadR family transcriptional regulator
MPDKNLGKLLEQLHVQLDNTEAVDEKGRELLRALKEDIQELLDRSESGQAEDSLLERLQDVVDHFEVTHPSLTSALSQILTSLSNAGI